MPVPSPDDLAVAAPKAVPARKRRSPLRTIGGLTSLLLVLTILGAAALFGLVRYRQIQALLPKLPQNTSVQLPTVAPKPGYTIYADGEIGFSLQYPDAWSRLSDRDKHDPGYRGDRFAAGKYAALEVGTSPQYRDWEPLQIDSYVLNGVFAAPGVNVQFVDPTSPTVHVAGLDWTAQEANVTMDTGIVVHMASLALIYQGQGYVIFYFAPQNQFTSYSDTYFAPMLLSFRFLTG